MKRLELYSNVKIQKKSPQRSLQHTKTMPLCSLNSRLAFQEGKRKKSTVGEFKQDLSKGHYFTFVLYHCFFLKNTKMESFWSCHSYQMAFTELKAQPEMLGKLYLQKPKSERIDLYLLYMNFWKPLHTQNQNCTRVVSERCKSWKTI